MKHCNANSNKLITPDGMFYILWVFFSASRLLQLQYIIIIIVFIKLLKLKRNILPHEPLLEVTRSCIWL